MYQSNIFVKEIREPNMAFKLRRNAKAFTLVAASILLITIVSFRRNKDNSFAVQTRFIARTDTLDILRGGLFDALAKVSESEGGLGRYGPFLGKPRSQSRVECRRTPFLLIEVHSRPSNFKRREAIRFSWGQPENVINQAGNFPQGRSWKTVFMIGRSQNKTIQSALDFESKKSSDIVFGDFEDSYSNLYKKMVLGIRWAHTFCTADYILKTDDDCYINAHALITWLDSYHMVNASQPLYTGRLVEDRRVIRDKEDRNYLSMEEYPDAEFPAYIAGGGYLFSGFLLLRLISGSKRVKMFPVEDACFGTIMNEIRVRPTNDLRFLPFIFCGFDKQGDWRDIYVLERPLCELLGPFVIHGLRPEGQINLHYNVRILTAVSRFCSLYQRKAWLWAKQKCDENILETSRYIRKTPSSSLASSVSLTAWDLAIR